MAEVRIDRYDAEDGYLPRLCMKCGAPADTFVNKTMSWHPPWVLILLLAGLIPFVIVALIMTKRISLRAPMCPLHRNHWFSRSLSIGLSFLGLAVIGVGSFILIANGPNRNPNNDALFGLFCIGSLVLLLAWLVLVAVLSHTSIRPKEITDWEAHLTNVSPMFVDEYDGIYAEEYDEPRPRRRRRRPVEDDWDEERPRRRRPPPIEEASWDEDRPPPRRPAPPDAFEQQ